MIDCASFLLLPLSWCEALDVMQDLKRKDHFHRLSFDGNSNESTGKRELSSRQLSPKYHHGQLSPKLQGQFLLNLELIVSTIV